MSREPASDPGPRVDALLPAEIARRAEAIGEQKCGLDATTTLVLGILAGAFIGLGAALSATASAGAAGVLPFGVTRLIAGAVFALGLILVVVAGAELFTGNNLIVMAWASRKVSSARVLRNWGLVYLGNAIGAIATAALLYLGGQYQLGGGAVGRVVLDGAAAKLSYGFGQAFVLGIACNALVCLAVWLSYSARSVTDKVIAVVPPIAAFVAMGFEHVIANLYAVPLALLIERGAPPEFWAALGKTPADYAALTVGGFLLDNVLPVTLGNVVGGAGLVGLVYWFVYLRRPKLAAREP